MATSNINAIYANLHAKLSLKKVTESIVRLSSGKRNNYGGDAASQSLSNTHLAKAASQNAAGNNLRDGITAIEIADNSLDEIAGLNTRLAELGALYANNSLLSTDDIASLNKETAIITAAIDAIVSGTKYNGVALMGTSDVTFVLGATPSGSNNLTVTIGAIGSIASITAASNASATAVTLATAISNVEGQIAGASNAAKARRDLAYTAESILNASATSLQDTDFAKETANLTKNVLLNKISLSLAAQANSIEYSKLDLLS